MTITVIVSNFHPRSFFFFETCQIPLASCALRKTDDGFVSLCFPLAGVFALLQAVAFLKYVQSFLSKTEFKYFFFVATALAAGAVFVTVVGLTWAGVIAPWSGRYNKIR